MKEDEGNKSETFALSSLWNSRCGKKVFVCILPFAEKYVYNLIIVMW